MLQGYVKDIQFRIKVDKRYSPGKEGAKGRGERCDEFFGFTPSPFSLSRTYLSFFFYKLKYDIEFR